MNYPFSRKRPNPKRDDPRRVKGRVRLHGDGMSDLRHSVFVRSGGKCERLLATGQPHHAECPIGVPESVGNLAHLAHGPRKTDTPEGTYWASQQCHMIEDHNPKSCPRRPGKVMRLIHAKAYWAGVDCFCEKHPKKSGESFCPEYRGKCSAQILYDLEHTDDPNIYREALAQAEIEIITAERTA